MISGNKYIYIVLILLFLNNISLGETLQDIGGFRASRVMPGEFPDPEYWSNIGWEIAHKFDNTQAAGIWIVSTIWGGGECHFHFPKPEGSGDFNNISFSNTDKNEEYLTRFDQDGLKVWLQVESGDANIDTLIDIVMERYSHHECVIGFGVDVEWFFTSSENNWEGRQVTSAEAINWENRIKSYNQNYTLLLKHWLISKMPVYKGDIVFVDDSQEFSGLNSMKWEFQTWGNAFPDNPVIFQVGYDSDKIWWNNFPDPVFSIGNELKSSIPNYAGIVWVDFTIKNVFPVNIDDETVDLPKEITLYQNYPNPFNNSTIIEYYLPEKQVVKCIVYDQTGVEILVLKEGFHSSGFHKVKFRPTIVSSGIYYISLQTRSTTINKKMIFLK